MAVTSTQPTVIDLLLKKIDGLDLTVNSEPVEVFDGPHGPDNPDNFVDVMGWPGDTSNGRNTWAGIGNRARYEDYDIQIHVTSFVGGGSDANAAQATARANAASIAASIETAITEDPDLSIQNGGTPAVIYCLVEGWDFDPLPDDPEELEMGRFANVTMRVNVYNRLAGPGGTG